MREESLFNKENVIYEYTQEQAIEDGFWLLLVGAAGKE